MWLSSYFSSMDFFKAVWVCGFIIFIKFGNSGQMSLLEEHCFLSLSWSLIFEDSDNIPIKPLEVLELSALMLIKKIHFYPLCFVWIVLFPSLNSLISTSAISSLL